MSPLPPIRLFSERPEGVRYVMAPMAGITDITFRTLIRGLGAQIVVSELISAEGLIRGGQKTLDLMRFCDEERPVGIQIFGAKVETLVEAAKIVEQKGADFVDVNFGCPVKKVVCDGGGAAWLRDPKAMEDLLGRIKSAIGIPLTIKVRTGWDEGSINVKEVVLAAARAGVGWVAIHGRTRAQGYSGLADWDLIRSVAVESPIPIVGNGDILTAAQAKHRIDAGYCHAVMIGRGVLKNPWLFREILDDHAGPAGASAFTSLVSRHFELALEHKGTYRAFLSLKKFMAWYASGYPGASAFRKSLFDTSDLDELRGLCLEYFASRSGLTKIDDGQPFLMGGHG